jgi:hypothetical protein
MMTMIVMMMTMIMVRMIDEYDGNGNYDDYADNNDHNNYDDDDDVVYSTIVTVSGLPLVAPQAGSQVIPGKVTIGGISTHQE